MEKLQYCYDELITIRTYLVKLGSKRRQQQDKCNKKKCEADLVISKCNEYLLTINLEKSKYEPDEILLLDNLTSNIASLYQDIVKYCEQETDINDTTPDSEQVDESNSVTVTMEKFDLKTAVSLLPIMDNSEEKTKQLISAIEMYSSMLDTASHKTLITFVLKTRLSEGAKLTMSQNYDTVTLLLSDMKKYLLAKKSFTAIQQQLQKACQKNKSIEAYGKEIESLFNELTIAQADGDAAKYEILRPLNEQTAIKRFADGLQNGHLSTIVSARDYKNLKDAIRGAKDEEVSTSSQGSVMRMEQNRYFSNRSSYRGRGRGNYRYQTHQYQPRINHQRGFSTRGYGPAPATQSQQATQPRGRYQNRNRAFIFTSDFIRAYSIENSEKPRRPLKIDLNALKNAAEVVKVLKALNDDDDLQTSQEKEGYGKREEKAAKGIDLDYLGIDGERNEDIQELLELMQKNRDANENYELMGTEPPRLYFISNPEVLEKYREMIKQGKEKDSTSSSDNEESSGMRNVWELLNAMRRGGDADQKEPSKKMILHPRLLQFNLEHDVPSIGSNIVDKHEGKNEKVEKKKPDVLQYLRVIKHENKDDDGKLADASDNLDATKMPLSSLENTENSAKDALRTTYKYHERDEANDKSDTKKDSLENKSVDNDKRVTKIDFKANSREDGIDDKSLESYKHPKRAKKTKGSSFDDDNNKFVQNSMETHKNPKKETKNDNYDSADYGKMKQKRWEKQEDSRNRWDKPENKGNRWDKPENKGNSWDKPENKGNSWDKPENKGNRWDKPENKGNRWDTPENKGNRWDKPENKGSRWDKPENKGNRWDKPYKFEEKKFTTLRKEPKNQERNYAMNRPRINPLMDKPGPNKMTNPRENNAPKISIFKAFGRTPVPVVGNRGIYEDD